MRALLWTAGLVLLGAQAVALDIYVAPGGNDARSGRSEAEAVATPERARDLARELRAGTPEPVTVWFAGGDYLRDAPLLLESQDGGTADAPVAFRAMPGANVRFVGGRFLDTWTTVDDAETVARIQEAARPHVLRADLAAHDATAFGKRTTRGFGRGVKAGSMELFIGREPMTPARWPNDEWAKIASVPEGETGVFQYDGDRPGQWTNIDDIWVHGYWTWDWAESYEHVARIDPETKSIHTHPPHGVYGYKKDRRYYAENILEELDQPGEWYFDRANASVYLWPPEPLNKAEVAVSLLGDALVRLQGASYVTIEGITFEYGRSSGIIVTGGSYNRVEDCTFTNLGTFGVKIEPGGEEKSGRYNGVVGCTMYNLGAGGIHLLGGKRETLTPGANYATDNHIYDFSRIARTYRPAVQVSGVRNRVAHNHIHNAPHMAIGLSGNEHIIEYNDIHHVCMETHDSGAFYLGRDWTWRQNIVRYNYFHELGDGDVNAVYLDDWGSDTVVFGNIVYKAKRGVLVGGGRDNVIDNNIFVDCQVAVHIDQRGLGWANYYFDGKNVTLFDRLEAMRHDQPPYSMRYPQLVPLLGDEPAYAKYNHVLRNISVNSKFLDLRNDLTEEQLDAADNWTEGDPGFVDAANQDFRLKPHSPVWTTGFQRIPVERIGPRPKGERR
jgi:hypothetical protein